MSMGVALEIRILLLFKVVNKMVKVRLPPSTIETLSIRTTMAIISRQSLSRVVVLSALGKSVGT